MPARANESKSFGDESTRDWTRRSGVTRVESRMGGNDGEGRERRCQPERVNRDEIARTGRWMFARASGN